MVVVAQLRLRHAEEVDALVVVALRPLDRALLDRPPVQVDVERLVHVRELAVVRQVLGELRAAERQQIVVARAVLAPEQQLVVRRQQKSLVCYAMKQM